MINFPHFGHNKIFLKSSKPSILPTFICLSSGTIPEKSNEQIWKKVQKC